MKQPTGLAFTEVMYGFKIREPLDFLEFKPFADNLEVDLSAAENPDRELEKNVEKIKLDGALFAYKSILYILEFHAPT